MATFKSKVREFLKNNTIDILEECKEVIQIDSKMPVYEAFQVHAFQSNTNYSSDLDREEYLECPSMGRQ